MSRPSFSSRRERDEMTADTVSHHRAIPNVLSIAGSDPSGGAGIQADLKAFSARGVYGMAAITALTAQNTRGVSGVDYVAPAFVAAQIETVLEDIRVDAVKIGMLANAGIITAVADVLSRHPHIPVVLDPVMVAKGGASLLDGDAVAALKRDLVPLATLVTPNLPETAALLADDVAETRAVMEEQAHRLRALGSRGVLIKGGHLGTDESPDLLLWKGEVAWIEGHRIETLSTHGTGCSLSSAIAAEIAKGASMPDAVTSAKVWLTRAIAAAEMLSVGQGHGPVHHFHALW